MHVSMTIELNPQFLACATLHAKLCCLLILAACACCQARKGRGVQPPPLLAARLDASCGPSPA